MVFEPPGMNTNAGFHDSEHTYPVVTIYQQGDDPIVLSAQPLVGFNLEGRKETDSKPSVMAVQTYKDIGSASGTFQITLKPSQAAETLFKKLVDDDWIDIVFYKKSEPYHVLRGLIDEVRRTRNVGGTGATTETFTITGRDFGKVWEQTPIWFSPFANDFVTQAVSTQIFDGVPEIYGSPGAAPITFLRDFMEKFSSLGGVNWAPPLGIPGLTETTFTGNVNFCEKFVGEGSSIYFQNKPMRNQYNANGMNPQGMAWQLAREYSDPMFTEMYVDLLPPTGPYSPEIGLGMSMPSYYSKMTVVLRDKPFYTLPTSTVPLPLIPYWEKVPIHNVTRQEITTDDVGRSGFERYNAIFVAPKLHQEAMASHALYVMAPLMDKESVKRHGLRRLDIQSNVVPDPTNRLDWGGPDISKLADYQRNLMRDWYCMNPYFLSGTISIGHARPDIKIGNRLRIPGRIDANPLKTEGEENYYIENVTQNWQAGQGLKTSVGVTRGWVGTDTEYKVALTLVAKRYKLPPMAVSVA